MMNSKLSEAVGLPEHRRELVTGTLNVQNEGIMRHNGALKMPYYFLLKH